MQEKEKQEEERIDELIDRIDAFMANGGGHMNVTGGEGEATVKRCATCCGEFSDSACNTPAKE